MESVLWNKVWIFINLEEKAIGDNLSMMTFLFFFADGSNKAAPVLRLEGQKVGDELLFSVWHLSFQPLVQSSLILSTECCELAKSDFKLQLFSHFWNVNEDFSTGQLVDPFNDLLTFFIFLVYYLRSFLYKCMLLSSFITEPHAQPSAFFSCFQEFFFWVLVCFFSFNFFFFFTCY